MKVQFFVLKMLNYQKNHVRNLKRRYIEYNPKASSDDNKSMAWLKKKLETGNYQDKLLR